MAEEARKMPEEVSEEKIGITQIEEDWRNLPDPRPPVSRWVFFSVGLAIIIAVALSGLWYYHKNVVPERRYARAVNYLQDGDYVGAYRLFEEVYEVKPKRKDVIYSLGRCLEKMERYDAAAARYREQLDKVPYHGKAMQRLGALYVFKLGKTDEGLALIKKGAEKLDTPEGWENVVLATIKLNNKEETVNALNKEAGTEKDAAKITALADRLFALEAYEQALDAYEKAFGKDKNIQSAANGIKAARLALGLPDTPEHTVTAGKALGTIKLESSKKQVKEQLGSPEKKLFVKVGAGEYQGETAEIWYYGLEKTDKFRIIFIKEKAVEIETASEDYKTEEGLGIATFTDERFADRFEKQPVNNSKTVIYTAKDGGIAFYAETGRKGRLRYKKLRIFKGSQSGLDNAEGLLLLKQREK